MKHRSPAAVFFLPFITFGIYALVWEVKTKNEMNALGADIPTAWLIIVPIVNIWWMWKYCEGVDKVTKSELSAVISFLVLFLLGSIGMAIIQNEFNKLSPQTTGAGTSGAAPTPPSEPETPAAPPVEPPSAV